MEGSSLQRVEDFEAEGAAEAPQEVEEAEEGEVALEQEGRSWLSHTGMKVCITCL